jgi:dTDP-glucose 4,6-dehydratase
LDYKRSFIGSGKQLQRQPYLIVFEEYFWRILLRLLATGAAGFIGSNFVRMITNGLLDSITDVKVLDKLTYAGVKENLKPAENFPNYQFIQGDICDPLLVSRLISEVDAVVNFAAESHVDRSITGAADFVQTNIVGVQVLLDAIKASGRRIRFLQVSTDEVYGSIEEGSWTEEWPLLPNSPYSASKASGELLARSYNRTHGMDVLITRCSNNYGTHHFPEKLIPLFITNLIEGKKVPVYGTGENVRDWLHVDDHCRGIYQVLMNGRSGEVYNIGGGRELTNNEITSLILNAMGADESSIEYVEDRKGHDLRYSVDWTKIKGELGYEPQVSFEDGLRETIQWYRDNEAWWNPLKDR